jgi:translocation and assembly module TamA
MSGSFPISDRLAAFLAQVQGLVVRPLLPLKVWPCTRGGRPVRGLAVLMLALMATGAPQAVFAAQQQVMQGGDIIPQEEFDASIPPIEDDLGQPMAPVGEWDAEQKRLEDDAFPPAPVNDPELDAPLPPLEGFEVQPFDVGSLTEEEKPAPVHYRYRIDGLAELDGADIEPRIDGGDIIGRFKNLSVLEDGDGKAANGATINARLREDEKLLADILSGQGFFDAQVRSRVDLPEEGSREALLVVMAVQPGKRYLLGDIRLDAPALVPVDLATAAFAIEPAEPIVAERVLAAEANLKVVLPQNGYPFAALGQRDILLDEETGKGNYVLPIRPGPRSRFGNVLTMGAKPVFKPDHIATIARHKKGELYDSRMVDDLRQALIATSLFSAVSVQPVPTGVDAGDGAQYADLLVKQEAGPKRTIAVQAGYETGQGLKVEGSWTHRNLFPPEGALIGKAVAGTQEQALGAIFRRSNAGQRDRTVELSLSAEHNNFDAYESWTGRFAGRISRDSTPLWQKRWTWNGGFELLASQEEDWNFAQESRNWNTYYIAGLSGQIAYDASNSLLDPTRGFRLSAKLMPEASLGSGTLLYGRGLFDATGYYPVSDNLVVAGRARVGLMLGASRGDIAPSRRFYAGGGGSVRGFGYQELGPKDPEDNPIGGESVVEAAAEVRYRFGNYGVVAFVDGGQVYRAEIPNFTNWRFGAGVGGRFYTNFGPMRLDVAMPLGRKPGESKFALYVSIGQAF